MIQKYPFLLLCLVVLYSCHPDPKENPVETALEAEPDTAILLTVNGITKTFMVKKNFCRITPDLQAFLHHYPNVPPNYQDTLHMDVTGDSIPEKIITRIENRNGNSILYSKVLINDEVILNDTLDPDDELSFMGWYSDSIYYKLKPHSVFYETFNSKDRVEELENGKISEELIEFYVQGVIADAKRNGMDSASVKLTTDSVTRELRNYKGKYVTTLDQWDRSLLIWNKYTHSFELLYAP